MYEKLIALLAGFVAPAAVDLVKRLFKKAFDKNLQNQAAFLAAAAVSVVLALFALFVSDKLSFSDFAVERLPETFAVVLAASEVIYKAVKYGRK